MCKFIEVTKSEGVGNKQAFINVDNISYIVRNENTCRIIHVGGTEENYSNVLQSYAEVKELIKQA